MSSTICFNLDLSKILPSGNGLNTIPYDEDIMENNKTFITNITTIIFSISDAKSKNNSRGNVAF